MALLDVSGFKSYSEIREQILPSRQTRLVDRTNHYNFGTRTQEFALPVGVNVSISLSKGKVTKRDASDAQRFI